MSFKTENYSNNAQSVKNVKLQKPHVGYPNLPTNYWSHI